MTSAECSAGSDQRRRDGMKQLSVSPDLNPLSAPARSPLTDFESALREHGIAITLHLEDERESYSRPQMTQRSAKLIPGLKIPIPLLLPCRRKTHQLPMDI